MRKITSNKRSLFYNFALTFQINLKPQAHIGNTKSVNDSLVLHLLTGNHELKFLFK